MRLNIACGLDVREAWLNLDCRTWESLEEQARTATVVLPQREEVDFRQVDVREGLPFEEGSVEEVLADNFLEHLSLHEPDELRPFLVECQRVIMPGAVLHGRTVDIERVFGLYLARMWCKDAKATAGPYEKPWENALSHMAHGWQHREVFTQPMVRQLLEGAGFVRVAVADANEFGMRFEAVKPESR